MTDISVFDHHGYYLGHAKKRVREARIRNGTGRWIAKDGWTPDQSHGSMTYNNISYEMRRKDYLTKAAVVDGHGTVLAWCDVDRMPSWIDETKVPVTVVLADENARPRIVMVDRELSREDRANLLEAACLNLATRVQAQVGLVSTVESYFRDALLPADTMPQRSLQSLVEYLQTELAITPDLPVREALDKIDSVRLRLGGSPHTQPSSRMRVLAVTLLRELWIHYELAPTEQQDLIHAIQELEHAFADWLVDLTPEQRPRQAARTWVARQRASLAEMPEADEAYAIAREEARGGRIVDHGVRRGRGGGRHSLSERQAISATGKTLSD